MEHRLRQLVVVIFSKDQLPANDISFLRHKSMRMDYAEGSGMPACAVGNRNRGHLARRKLFFQQAVKIKGYRATHVAFAALDQFGNRLERGPLACGSLAMRINLGAKLFEEGHLTVAGLSGAAFA